MVNPANQGMGGRLAMVARSAHPKEPLRPGASFPDLLISDRMLIYDEAHLRGHRPHQSRNQRPPDCNELAVVPLTAPVQRGKLLGYVHQRVPPGRLNHSMKQQLRYHHRFLERYRPEVIQSIWVIPLR